MRMTKSERILRAIAQIIISIGAVFCLWVLFSYFEVMLNNHNPGYYPPVWSFFNKVI